MRSSGTGRQRLRDFNTLDHVVDRLRTARKIIVVSGAGISVSTGIPDFRSRDGLYNTLDCAKIGIPSAELLFDMGFFEIDPAPFYRFAPALLPAQHIRPSPCHRFLALLQSRKQLLRNYTQNVDGLERRAGVTQAALMECHGSMATFKCTG
jgi:NAD-dependent SIR2 family protein deacetylase